MSDVKHTPDVIIDGKVVKGFADPYELELPTVKVSVNAETDISDDSCFLAVLNEAILQLTSAREQLLGRMERVGK